MPEKLSIAFEPEKENENIPMKREVVSAEKQEIRPETVLNLSASEAQMEQMRAARELQREESLQRLRAKFGVEVSGGAALVHHGTTKQPEAQAKTDLMEVSTINKKTGLVRLPPSFYREMIVLSFHQGDKETFDKFKRAVTTEEKGVIEKDAFTQSRESFQKLSEALSPLDFKKGGLRELHDALGESYEFLSTASQELHAIELVTGTSRYESLARLLYKMRLVISDLRGACQAEEYRQKESLWVRMFSKDRSKIIALSQILSDFRQELGKAYEAISRGESIDDAAYARLILSR